PHAPRAELADAFRLAGLLAFLLAAYALTLPHTPPHRETGARFAPLAAVSLLRGRAFVVFGLCTVGWSVPMPFPSQAMPLLLEHLGIPRQWLSPVLTISQTSEIVALGLLPVLLLRLGVGGTMLLGLTAWLLGMTVWMAGQPAWLVVGMLSMHGLCISCFSVA